ncbi:DUF4384 domain-containing protein [Desulfococcaceae bacterium HSG7]|nr:DUF4384 domain-containing protein [Desulfococcaceae bacterium HSG7]
MDSKLPRNTEETAGALIEAFRRANLNRPPDFDEECAMSDKTLAYAMDEAEPQERAEIKEHLITCRECVDLYFDVRMSKKQAEASSQQPVPMSAESRAVIYNSSASASVSIFQKITADVLRYLSFLTTRQRFASVAAGFAMTCLAVYFFMPRPLEMGIAMTAKPMTVRGASSLEAPFQVKEGDTLKTSERFQVKITTNKDTYGYVILAGTSGRINTSGRIKTLYSGKFKAGEPLFIPDAEKWEKLDYHSGTERIYLIATKRPIGSFDKKITELKSVDVESIEELFPDASLYGFGFEHE